jgi:hypothetical protein
MRDRRLFSDYSKGLSAPYYTVNFAVTDANTQAMVNIGSDSPNGTAPNFIAGVSHEHYVKTTGDGLSFFSPITSSLGVAAAPPTTPSSLVQSSQLTEAVFYSPDAQQRYIQSSVHPPRFEAKQRILTKDIAVPASSYDFRLTLSTESPMPAAPTPPKGMLLQREKSRKSYVRKDGRFAWQLDVTTVTTQNGTSYELEMELVPEWTKKLVGLKSETPEQRAELDKIVNGIAEQLVWMLGHLSPVESDLDVANFLQPHKDKKAVDLARRQCGALRSYSEGNMSSFNGAVEHSHGPSLPHAEKRFIGSMPTNFQRHHIDSVVKGDYYVSEKTDGVRYLLIFTGSTAVLLDRTMTGWSPIPVQQDTGGDPFLELSQCVQPGTVFDGEVVINRLSRKPQFIIFDVLCQGLSTPLTRHIFSERLRVLKSNDWLIESAHNPAAGIVDTDLATTKSACPALPLVRKVFQRRSDVDALLDRVKVDRGLRMYYNGPNHQHLTDGIIFQPNRAYALGTDFNLLKWKYLDTATVDVEVQADSEGNYTFVCDAGDGAVVDMSRYIKLPPQELVRLEADRTVTNCKIAEVGFNPIGEWYYKCMRTDKDRSNHISTVMGTLLELAEGISATEIRIRMMPGGVGDSYDRNLRVADEEMLKAARGSGGSGRNGNQAKKRKLDN